MQCVNFAFAFIPNGHSGQVPQETKHDPSPTSPPGDGSPSELSSSRRLSAVAFSAARYLVTSPGDQADSLRLPEDARLFDWLFRTPVSACSPFRVRAQRGRPCGGVR